MISSLDTTSRANVTQSIELASLKTGADFSYLLGTAMRESSLNPEAKARTSSATGLFQFIEQTWFDMIERHGADHGLGAYADAIERQDNGRYVVTDKAMRREILALRKDAQLSALMAGELAEENRQTLEGKLGRPVSEGELYAAHFLGVQGAAKLLKAAGRTPGETAADLFPEAAAANRSIFYDTKGRARTVGEVYEKVTMLPKVETPKPNWEPDLPTEPDLMYAGLRGSHGLTDQNDQPPDPLRVFAGQEQALILNPGIISILASLDMLPEDGTEGQRRSA